MAQYKVDRMGQTAASLAAHVRGRRAGLRLPQDADHLLLTESAAPHRRPPSRRTL